MPQQQMSQLDSVSSSIHLSGLSDWEKRRYKGIGGSDAPIIMGVSPWSDITWLWHLKTGRIPPKKLSDKMARGNEWEPIIRKRLEKLLGTSIDTPSKTFTHPKHPFMLANIDGIAGYTLIEIKTSSWPKDWTKRPPRHVNVQCQHYMEVLDLPRAVVAVQLFRGIKPTEFHMYELERDTKLGEELVEREASFWKAVQEDVEPTPF